MLFPEEQGAKLLLFPKSLPGLNIFGKLRWEQIAPNPPHSATLPGERGLIRRGREALPSACVVGPAPVTSGMR